MRLTFKRLTAAGKIYGNGAELLSLLEGRVEV